MDRPTLGPAPETEQTPSPVPGTTTPEHEASESPRRRVPDWWREFFDDC